MRNDKQTKKENKMNFKELTNEYMDSKEIDGNIPEGSDLVVVERDDVDNGTFDSAMVLYGWDEIDSVEINDDIVSPVYGFLTIN
ncbi:hypothetical protein H8D04_00010 [bacterium]|nr:hypothetical protein [bacterium]